ncbi:MAG: hypothetical protein QOE71_1050 [Pseudonocardiales bacterium]|nr:hypothetical protein [Pseudonocardiales bacterium]
MAAAADRAGAHSTAPALLLQVQSALGRLAGEADQVTEGGRRPYRVSAPWAGKLAELAYLVYMLADQTAVSVEAEVRAVAARVDTEETARQARLNEPEDSVKHDWI